MVSGAEGSERHDADRRFFRREIGLCAGYRMARGERPRHGWRFGRACRTRRIRRAGLNSPCAAMFAWRTTAGLSSAALDLNASGDVLDASAYRGPSHCGSRQWPNNIHYTCELRTQRDPGSPTGRISLPARAGKRSTCHSMHSHHTGSIHTLDTQRLKRLGLVAIGRAFSADLKVSSIRLYE